MGEPASFAFNELFASSFRWTTYDSIEPESDH